MGVLHNGKTIYKWLIFLAFSSHAWFPEGRHRRAAVVCGIDDAFIPTPGSVPGGPQGGLDLRKWLAFSERIPPPMFLESQLLNKILQLWGTPTCWTPM